MEIGGFDRYTLLETALKEAGFMMVGAQKQGKRTVITVFRHGENPVVPGSGASPGLATDGELGSKSP